MRQQSPDFSDDILSAFLDGELPALEMAAVRTALAQDLSLADRLAALAMADKLVRQHAHAIDHEPLPAGVLALLDTKPQQQAAAPVSAQILSGPWQHWRQQALRPLAMAASVALVLSLAIGYLNDPGPSTAALPELARYAASLDSTPSGTAVGIGAATLLPRFSFRAADGAYCRQYQLVTPTQGAEYVACRQEQGWSVLGSVEAPAAGSENFMPASSSTAGLDALLDTLMQGPALDAATEAALIRQGWQAP